jgi:uncharacterized protein (TIGR03084 family)
VATDRSPKGGPLDIFDDLEAEEDRLETILSGLDDGAWASPSAAGGWSVKDVVLHLTQSEELVVTAARLAGSTESGSSEAFLRQGNESASMDELMGARVRAERSPPDVVFTRWKKARREALDFLRNARPRQRIPWATNPLPPATLATTRLAEHWAHGLDIVEPLRIPFEDTARLRHIAWLAHRTLPYAFSLAMLPPVAIRCELTGPDGECWEFGPVDAPSRIAGSAGEFCRVGARRLSPDRTSLRATGPYGTDALRLLRNYAE